MVSHLDRVNIVNLMELEGNETSDINTILNTDINYVIK
jgi:hypothetical protein